MRKIIAVLCASSVLWGCTPVFQGTVAYKSKTYAQPSAFPATVAVLPLKDQRPSKSHMRLPLIILPIVLYGTFVEDRIEKPTPFLGTQEFNQYGYPKGFSPSLFLQNSLAEELKQSRLFENAVPVQSEQQAQMADLVLKGELLSTRANATDYGYGITIYGAWAFWMLGLPVCKGAQDLAIKLELVRPGAAKPLWTGYVNEKWTGVEGWYYKTGVTKEYIECLGPGFSKHGGQLLNEVLAMGMAKIAPSLVRALKAQSPDFWQEIEDSRTQRKAFQPQATGEQAPAGPSSFQKALEQIQKELGEE